MNKKVKFSGLWTAILSVVSVAYIFPILLVLINSFKKKAYISRYPFAIPTDKMFVGLENYVNGLTKTGFFQAFGWTLFITVFFCCGNSALYLHVCLVHQPCYQHADKNHVHAVPVFHGRTIPDGNVYSFQDRKHPETEYSVGTDHHLSWIWSRTCGIYVQRFCKIHSDRDRGSCHDRWLYPDPDIFLKWFFRL